MSGVRQLAAVFAAVVVAVPSVAGAATAIAADGVSTAAGGPSGPNAIGVRCAGRWAPIQAKVSGFVVGNCRGGTVARGIALDECAPGCVRGARKEGRAWEAVSFPRAAHFAACGWVNVQNRLRLGGQPPIDRCHRRAGPDFPFLESYVKRFSGRAVAGARLPSTVKYRGLYLWAGHFTSGANRGREGGAIAYTPRFTSDPSKQCTAYANVNPWLPGQQVLPSERMWSVHNGSRHLQIRYLARYRAKNEQGDLRWWVNVHSTAPSDRDQPWGFVAAECLFDVRAAPTSRADRAAGEPSIVQRRCGFAPIPFHAIVARRGMTCAAAKAALRTLRGDHDLAPVACARPRTVGGWHLRNLARDPSLGVTRYTRAGRSFDFERHQFPGNIWCPAPS